MTTPEVACGINVYCSGPDDPKLAEAMTDMGRLGYSHIAFGPMDPGQVNTANLKQMMADAGIRPIAMAGLTPDSDVSSPDEAVRAKGAAALKATVDFAYELGADQMNGVSYAVFGERSEPFNPERLAASSEILGQVAEYARSAGIVMTFEVVNRYETAMLNTAQQAVEYVQQANSSNLKVHLDTYHMGIEEADMGKAIRDSLPWLGYLELGQSGRGSLLTGAVDVRDALQAAEDGVYTGRIGLEAFTRQLLDAPVANGLAIWRQTYHDPHQVAAEAIALVRSVFETN